jgi:hypothetical protein
MIINIPTSDSFILAGKNLLGRSWSRLISLKIHHERMNKKRLYFGFEEISEDVFWWECRDFLAECISTSQHAAELILKGEIIKVDPFLILENHLNYVNSKQEKDFADIKSLDSVKLINSYESATGIKLDSNFKAQFESVRKKRNKYMHSVVDGMVANAKEALTFPLVIYGSLVKSGTWLEHRLVQIFNEINFVMAEENSVEGVLRNEVVVAINMLDTSVSKKYLGLNKKWKFWICPLCSNPLFRYYTAYEIDESTFCCYGCQEKFPKQFNCLDALEQKRIIYLSFLHEIKPHNTKSCENELDLPFGYLMYNRNGRKTNDWPALKDGFDFALMPKKAF